MILKYCYIKNSKYLFSLDFFSLNCKNMKLQIRVTKTWGRFMLGCQSLRVHETWLPKLSSRFSNPFRPGTQWPLPKRMDMWATPLLNFDTYSITFCFSQKTINSYFFEKYFNLLMRNGPSVNMTDRPFVHCCALSICCTFPYHFIWIKAWSLFSP